MSKVALFLQPFGLGDCIFAQGIARDFIARGYKIYWPVVLDYLYDLRRAYPVIDWVPENLAGLSQLEREEIKTAQVVPIRWSDTFTGVGYERVMRAKYDMYGLDWTQWRQGAQWARNLGIEAALQQRHSLRPGSEYAVVSESYGTGGKMHANIPPPASGIDTITLRQLPGYSLFDWVPILQGAQELHLVASSNIYLLEALPELTAPQVHLYTRRPSQPHHRYYDYILTRHKYKLMR